MSRRPSLIFLMPSLAGGGAERVAASLLPLLMEHFELKLALLEDRQEYAVPPGLPVTAFSPPLTGPLRHLGAIPAHLRLLGELVRTCEAPAVISFLEQANIINCLASRRLGYAAVISQRIEPRRQYGGKGLLGKMIRLASRRTYPLARHLISVSGGIRKILIEDYRLDPAKITVIPNPLDLEALTRQAEEEPQLVLPKRYLLHVGRLRLAAKGQDLLLAAFRQVVERFPDLHLVLVGLGPDREAIEGLVLKAGLADRVLLAGWQKNAAAIMARAELFILPSRYEGWPNVLTEAMALGRAVIAADCPTGPREILGVNEFGLLVPPEDPQALAAAMVSLLEHAVQRARYERQAQQRARDFSLNKVGEQYLQVLDQVISASGATP